MTPPLVGISIGVYIGRYFRLGSEYIGSGFYMGKSDPCAGSCGLFIYQIHMHLYLPFALASGKEKYIVDVSGRYR